jgi:hypothetical protein
MMCYATPALVRGNGNMRRRSLDDAPMSSELRFYFYGF